jgi:hypothetical protein
LQKDPRLPAWPVSLLLSWLPRLLKNTPPISLPFFILLLNKHDLVYEISFIFIMS